MTGWTSLPKRTPLTAVERFVDRILPAWFPRRRNFYHRILLFQLGGGACGLLAIVLAQFGVYGYGLFDAFGGRAMIPSLISWCFAAICAPLGIFQGKAWGYLLEIPASAAIVAFLYQFFISDSGFSDGWMERESMKMILIAAVVGYWMYWHAKAGLKSGQAKASRTT